MIDSQYVVFENNNTIFPTYNQAYYNSKHCSDKRVKYVFTPTFEKFNHVGELENACRSYFSSIGYDYIDVKSNFAIIQMNLFER